MSPSKAIGACSCLYWQIHDAEHVPGTLRCKWYSGDCSNQFNRIMSPTFCGYLQLTVRGSTIHQLSTCIASPCDMIQFLINLCSKVGWTPCQWCYSIWVTNMGRNLKFSLRYQSNSRSKKEVNSRRLWPRRCSSATKTVFVADGRPSRSKPPTINLFLATWIAQIAQTKFVAVAWASTTSKFKMQ